MTAAQVYCPTRRFRRLLTTLAELEKFLHRIVTISPESFIGHYTVILTP